MLGLTAHVGLTEGIFFNSSSAARGLIRGEDLQRSLDLQCIIVRIQIGIFRFTKENCTLIVDHSHMSIYIERESIYRVDATEAMGGHWRPQRPWEATGHGRPTPPT